MKKLKLTIDEFFYIKDKEETFNEIYYYAERSRFLNVNDNDIVKFTFGECKSHYKYRANIFDTKVIFLRSKK